jgi:hypothetical protein
MTRYSCLAFARSPSVYLSMIHLSTVNPYSFLFVFPRKTNALHPMKAGDS